MTYNEIVTSAPVVLVEFYATWCPHCQRMMPVVEQVRKSLDGKVPVEQLDIDKNNSEADEAGVKSIPTFIIYKNGKEVWRHLGEIDGQVLLSQVESFE